MSGSPELCHYCGGMIVTDEGDERGWRCINEPHVERITSIHTECQERIDALQAENEELRSRLKRLRVNFLNLRAKRVQIQRQLDALQAENERLEAALRRKQTL